MNPLVSVADTVPAILVRLPTLSVTLAVVRLAGSSTESVATRIPVKESGEAVRLPLVGVTDWRVGTGQAALASSVVAAV